MTLADCFECGSGKLVALLARSSCGAAPRANIKFALSLVLTEHFSSKSQPAYYSHELRDNLKFSVPSDVLAQAQKALKDPQLIAMLGAQLVSDPSTNLVPTKAPSRPAAPLPAQPLQLPHNR